MSLQSEVAIRHYTMADEQQSVAAGARVLLVGPLPPPPLTGGVETGVALLLGTPLARTAPIMLFNTARTEDPDRATYRRVAFQVAMCGRFVAALLKHRPRIVHIKTSSGINFYQNALYLLLARLLGRRAILQLHSGHFPYFYRDAGRVGQTIIRVAMRMPHVLVALSPTWARFMESFRGGRAIAVVPNAIEAVAFAGVRADRARFAIPQDRIVALFVGTRSAELDVEKGLPHLIEAVAQVRRRHPELLLVLAGQACQALDLSPSLGARGDGWQTLGVVPREEKPVLYSSADLFTLPSLAENMPNSLLEAMAAGLPVVATPVGAIPDIVVDGESGLLVPMRDSDSLANAIERLVRDAPLRRALGSAAADRVRRNYDLSVLERQLASTYASLARIAA